MILNTLFLKKNLKATQFLSCPLHVYVHMFKYFPVKL